MLRPDDAARELSSVRACRPGVARLVERFDQVPLGHWPIKPFRAFRGKRHVHPVTIDRDAFLKALGKHLRRIRDDAGVRQNQLAQKIHMDPTNLNKIERGEKNLTIDTLLRLAAGLDARLEVRLAPKRARKR
jgi:plasmid maintenance system antidote protein VapI